MTDAIATEAPAITEGTVSAAPAAASPAPEQQQATPAETLLSDAPAAETKAETPAADDKAPAGAPEAYADFTLPEGVKIAPEVLENLQTLAKDLNLPQDKAQKVADLGAQMAQRWATQAAEAHEATAAEWLATSQTDKEFGGDKLSENVAVAKKALDAFGTPELRNLLNETKLGNHPEVVRLLVRAGKAISEDKLVTGTNGTATAPRTLADRMYPSPKS